MNAARTVKVPHLWAARRHDWWARQDSNLQPDRYERPALTIELQAPPRAAARRPATVRTLLTIREVIPQCRPARPGMDGGDVYPIPPKPPRIPPPCAISR